MLANLFDPKWWYMEIPRTGSSTLDRALFQVLPGAVSLYQKHWPILPTPFLDPNAPDVTGIVSIRNPYSRAVSCWQFFTKPGSISFRDWTRERLVYGFVNLQIEARPQSFWFNLHKWEAVIRQDHLEDDFWAAVHSMYPNLPRKDITRYNDINGDWSNRAGFKTSRPNPWHTYYCEESRNNVAVIYDTDFECLEQWYSRDFSEAISGSKS